MVPLPQARMWFVLSTKKRSGSAPASLLMAKIMMPDEPAPVDFRASLQADIDRRNKIRRMGGSFCPPRHGRFVITSLRHGVNIKTVCEILSDGRD